MAATAFNGGISMDTAADTYKDPNGNNLRVRGVNIEKTTAGTVTLADGAGTTVLVTQSINDGATLFIPFMGWETNGIQYKATSAGSALVRWLLDPSKQGR